MPLIDIYKYIEAAKELFSFTADNTLLIDAFEISIKLNHPIYDCLFLALAEQNQATFVSFDKRLINKAYQSGIKTILL